MSSSVDREPLSGVIRQNKRIVGAVCLPEENLLDFINEFNHCYGPMQLHIDTPVLPDEAEEPLYPVGAKRKIRRPTHPPQTAPSNNQLDDR